MHRFLNWCLKLEYSPDGRRQKGYTKASALEADWKYFRIYYIRVTQHEMSKEMGEAVRTVCIFFYPPKACSDENVQGMRHLVDKRGLNKQPRASAPVYGPIQRDNPSNPGKAIPPGVSADYSVSIQYYWAIYRQPETGNASSSVQAFTIIAPARSARRTSGADDRT